MTLATLWFGLVVAMLITYVVLDGFDLGVLGRVARSEAERDACLRSIGPVWDGNEVWLVAGGGVLFMAFPGAYARAFSGFYLPLMLTLWLLAARALAIELRHQLAAPVWRSLWDGALLVGSAGLSLVLGVALGNVVRGVPIDADGRFFVALWTDLGTEGSLGAVDWFTALVGVVALVVLALHGALWLFDRVGAPVRDRARTLARWLWPTVVVGELTVVAASLMVQPRITAALTGRPLTVALATIAAVALVGVRLYLARDSSRAAFLCAATHIAAMLACAAACVYPALLPGRAIGEGLTLHELAAPPSSLQTALWWWIPGIALAIGYFVLLYGRLPARFEVEDAGER